MPELTAQFETALRNIEPSTADKDYAPLAHAAVSEALAEEEAENITVRDTRRA